VASLLSSAGEPPGSRLSTGGLAVLALGALDYGLEQSIVLPALPNLASHYGASVIGIAWFATGFLLAAAIAIPLAARLGDLVGKKRMILLSLALISGGSLLCALTHTIGPAIAGRVLQGLGAGIGPLTLGLARDMSGSLDLPRVVGAVVGSSNVGAGIGFLVGGLLVDTFSAPAIFWFLFGTGVVLFIGVALLVPETPLRRRPSLDPLSTLLLAGGLSMFLLAVSKGQAWGWSSASIVVLFAGAALALGLFVWSELRAPEPLIDLRLVARRPFAAANTVALVFGFTFFIALFVVPQLGALPAASGGLGLSVTQTGLVLSALSFAGVLSAAATGRLTDRVGPARLVATGAAFGAAAYPVLAFAHGHVAVVVLCCIGVGLGWGAIPTSLYPIVLRNAGEDRSATAAAVTAVSRNVGSATGTTVAAVVIAAAAGLSPADTGYTRALLVAAAGACVILAASALLPRRREPFTRPG
jgi:MFS family permease